MEKSFQKNSSEGGSGKRSSGFENAPEMDIQPLKEVKRLKTTVYSSSSKPSSIWYSSVSDVSKSRFNTGGKGQYGHKPVKKDPLKAFQKAIKNAALVRSVVDEALFFEENKGKILLEKEKNSEKYSCNITTDELDDKPVKLENKLSDESADSTQTPVSKTGLILKAQEAEKKRKDETQDCRETVKVKERSDSPRRVSAIEERVTSFMVKLLETLKIGLNYKAIRDNPLMANEKEKKLLQIAKLLKDVLEDKEPQEEAKPPKVEKPKANESKKVQRLINLCTGNKAPVIQRVVLADLHISNKLIQMSYKDQKDALISVFGLKPKEFAGLTRNPIKGMTSFLVDEGALRKYLRTPINTEAGRLTPWVAQDLVSQASVATTVCSKLEAHKPHNRAIRRAASTLLSSLTANDLLMVAQEFILPDNDGIRPEGSQ